MAVTVSEKVMVMRPVGEVVLLAVGVTVAAATVGVRAPVGVMVALVCMEAVPAPPPTVEVVVGVEAVEVVPQGVAEAVGSRMVAVEVLEMLRAPEAVLLVVRVPETVGGCVEDSVPPPAAVAVKSEEAVVVPLAEVEEEREVEGVTLVEAAMVSVAQEVCEGDSWPEVEGVMETAGLPVGLGLSLKEVEVSGVAEWEEETLRVAVLASEMV